MEDSLRRDEKLLFQILKAFKFLRGFGFDVFEIHATGPETSVKLFSRSKNIVLFFLAECGSEYFDISILQKKILYKKEVMVYDLIKDHKKWEILNKNQDCRNIDERLEMYAKLFESEILPILEAKKWKL